jgi:hypothetical protein
VGSAPGFVVICMAGIEMSDDLFDWRGLVVIPILDVDLFERDAAV